MKKIYILFIALSAFFLMGCENDPIHYSGPDFVSFNEGAINKVVKENEDGILEITLGVPKQAMQIVLSVSLSTQPIRLQ
ncbi:hypothetical protein DXA95_16695 [Odoribacter sp. OF09-27XD]|nr:hypothetical protein [Odoribacter sp. OF09-27XD]RHV88230.1 hypothetical protein DXA95_16695 [Odoribacter sp. OF09-27XD]